MNPKNENLKVNNPLSVMETGETNIFEMKRSPIGMYGTYAGAIFVLVIVIIVSFGVLPAIVLKSNRTLGLEIGSLIFLVTAVLAATFVFVASKIYWGNRWILTSDSLTQVLQTSLFDKQSSQLSLGNLEDVTAQQDGMFAHAFHFGVLRVETAGERSKFVFRFCPNPEYYAQEILRARENFEQHRSGEENLQRPYRAEGAYQNSAGEQPSAGPSQNAPADEQGVNIDTEPN